MADKTKLSRKKYRVKVEFWVNVDAIHPVEAEQQGWESRMKFNGSGEAQPEFVEVERLGEY